jgi:5-oxoprolinase (ATP-hydrolysing) subunit C
VGMRLRGPHLPAIGQGLGLSMPMVRGAIQLPGGGQPIVLGPDHPTTGGYPLLGVVIRADLGLLFSLPAGRRIRFEPVPVETARSSWRAHAARFFDAPPPRGGLC